MTKREAFWARLAGGLLGLTFAALGATGCGAEDEPWEGELRTDLEAAVIGVGERIEAEGYSVMSGVQVEPSADGGQNVGWIDAGDWMVYSVSAPAGTYRLEARVASPSGAAFTVDRDAGATVLADFAVPATGGWQSWRTIAREVSLPGGAVELGVFASQGGWNLDWLRLTPLSGGAAGGGPESGTYRIISQVSGKAVDVAEVSTANGANIQQWGYGGGENQQFRVERLADGTYRILAVHSGKALDVGGWSTQPGGNVIQWPWTGGANQRWRIAATGEGWYRILNVHSGHALDVAGASTADGANVQQWRDIGGAAQRWRLEPVAGQPPPDDVETRFGRRLTWRDEFDGAGRPDPSRWVYDVGGGGWGNAELQTYTTSEANAAVSSGTLKIRAVRDGSGRWTSARIKTAGRGDWNGGYFEIRARVPRGRGTWPAIWMLPTDWVYGGWPASGEIDIMEHVGYDQDVLHTTIHTEAFNHMLGTQKNRFARVPGMSDQFRAYGLLWEGDRLTWYVDGEEFYSIVRAAGDQWPQWPFDQRFHLILNVAIGGTWGGALGIDPNLTEAVMEVDYVRVYR